MINHNKPGNSIMDKVLTFLLTVTSIVALTSCTDGWEKPGATNEEFETMKAACSAQAATHFPPKIRQVQAASGYTTPMTTTCSGSGTSRNCYTTGGQYIAPVPTTVDGNQAARDQDMRSCFTKNGWQLTNPSDK
jgi:hypothetical protein